VKGLASRAEKNTGSDEKHASGLKPHDDYVVFAGDNARCGEAARYGEASPAYPKEALLFI